MLPETRVNGASPPPLVHAVETVSKSWTADLPPARHGGAGGSAGTDRACTGSGTLGDDAAGEGPLGRGDGSGGDVGEGGGMGNGGNDGGAGQSEISSVAPAKKSRELQLRRGSEGLPHCSWKLLEGVAKVKVIEAAFCSSDNDWASAGSSYTDGHMEPGHRAAGYWHVHGSPAKVDLKQDSNVF